MKRIGILIIVLSLFFFSIESVFATSGCCSSHGGVNCNKIQSNGKVVCNDGWTGSSCAYSSMVKCEGYNPTASGSSQKSQNYVYGCTDKTAKNYNSKANKDNGSCIYYVYGCTDKTAKNYDSKANKDNGSCTYYVYGCTSKDSINYNSSAEKDDGSCIEAIYGCMDEIALNYNDKANISDDSCEYKTESETKDIYTNRENDNNELGEVNSSQSSEESDLATGIVSLGIFGLLGYFIARRFKK